MEDGYLWYRECPGYVDIWTFIELNFNAKSNN